MEGFRDRLGVQDADGRRKGAVEGALEIFGRDGGLKDKAGYLAKGVNPGIGASRTLRQWGLPPFAAEDTLQGGL